MVAYHTFFSLLGPVVVRCGRHASSAIRKPRGGEAIGLDMLLLDKEATLIQGRRADTNSEVEWEGMQARNCLGDSVYELSVASASSPTSCPSTELLIPKSGTSSPMTRLLS
ncbi:hypothetical protein Bca4012_028123 [Brassica carinata]